MLLLTTVLAQVLAGVTLVVSPAGPYQSIPDALAAAHDGDTVEVHGGSYAGPIVVDRAVTLVGVDGPVVDGGGNGTVVTLDAPGATLRGFVVRGSGRHLDGADAGVEVRAERAVVEDNHLEDVLFGVSLDNAAGSIVRRNTVVGKSLPIAERGDGLRLWYSSDVLLKDNDVRDTRDCVIWYSANLRMQGNRIEDQRYGLHFMYDDNADIERNMLRGNSVGAYMMYSRNVRLVGNLIADNRGPSGYGLGLKDMDDLTARENWLVDNRVGVWSDGSPRSMDASSRFERNLFAFNDVAVTLSPATQRNVLLENAFQDNLQQMSIQGGGTLRGNTWSQAGRGNYWSDYAGFDANADGVGDVPYRVEALFGDWMDRKPELRLFQFGLASDVVEFAARAFPALRPQPKLVDDAPLLVLPAISPPPFETAVDPRPGLAAAGALLALALAVVGAGRSPGEGSSHRPGASRTGEELPLTPALSPRERETGRPAPPTDSSPHIAPIREETPMPQPRETSPDAVPAVPAIEVVGLTRRFGEQVAVDGLGFSIAPGEVVALWGPNGAGKTSALKCILGLLPCDGEVRIVGRDARRHGPDARRLLGYVPQEVAFHDDLSVTDTVAFYTALRRLPADPPQDLLAALGLDEHRSKAVGALSGGLRQRLAVALALLGDPPLLILDEPTSNLDAAGRALVLRLLDEARRRGTAMLFASHRLDEVEMLADRVLVLEQGRLAFECRGADLAARLGRRLNLHLQVDGEDRDRALSLLQGGGLAAQGRNGHVIGVEVAATAKAVPIGVLERAGIAVEDFTLEEAGADRAEERP